MPDSLRQHLPLLAVLVVLAGLWLALRTSATRFEPGDSFDALLDRGQPVVVEFFGNT